MDTEKVKVQVIIEVELEKSKLYSGPWTTQQGVDDLKRWLDFGNPTRGMPSIGAFGSSFKTYKVVGFDVLKIT